VSTDLGIAYYYSNQPDRALEQFDRSLAIDPKHSKTLLNIGVVRAFGKQDLEGAAKAWERVLEVAPNSEEATRARQGLEGIRSAHPEAGVHRREGFLARAHGRVRRARISAAGWRGAKRGTRT
jgi:tetratricopeptide (TPR) repeat protein